MSSTDFLKRLYWPCAEECGNYAPGSNLGELYERIEETAAASKAFFDAEQSGDLGPLVTEVMNAYEMQGFVNGFRLGAKLAGELKVPAAETGDTP